MKVIHEIKKLPTVTIDDVDFGKAFLYESELYIRLCCSDFDETGDIKIIEPIIDRDYYIICARLTDGALVQLPYKKECMLVNATISYSL